MAHSSTSPYTPTPMETELLQRQRRLQAPNGVKAGPYASAGPLNSINYAPPSPPHAGVSQSSAFSIAPDPNNPSPVTTIPVPGTVSNPWDEGLNAAYKKYLGRTPDPSELVPMYANPGGFEGAVNTIKNSPEAYAYTNRPPVTPPPTTTPPPTNKSVNLPGWDPGRTDNDPKQVWGQFVQSKGGRVTGDDVRAFVASDPRWEIDPTSSQKDPHIRVKQSELDKWKPGTQSTWQDVIRDAGGASQGQFINVDMGTPGGSNTPPPSSPSAYTPLSPTRTGTVAEATTYLNMINHSLGGVDLTPAQLQEAATFVGYQPGQPITGDQVNRIVAEMYRRAGRALPPSAAPGGPTTTTGPAPLPAPPPAVPNTPRKEPGPTNPHVPNTDIPPGPGYTPPPLPASTESAPAIMPPPTLTTAAPYVPPAVQPASPIPTTSPVVGATPATAATRVTGGATPLSGQAGSLFDELMRRSRQGLTVDPNDPTIKASTDAYRAQQVQAERDYLTQLAEKGGANTNITAETRAAGEAVGKNTGAMEAQLMQQELTARRLEIQQALSGAQGLLTTEQQMQLQEELTSLQAAESHFQFVQSQAQQAQQFGASMAERGHEFGVSTDTQRSQFAAQQAEQARQFDAQYGQGAWEFMQTLGNSQYQAQQARALSQSQFRAGQGQQESQFRRTQAQNAKQFAATMGLDYANLAEADKQFIDTLMQRAYEFDTNDQFRKSPLA